ncbi:MAG TPA: pyridoxamine 5'-phosphate oxidase [Candidatus Dormibacteraeota bacterium]|jgi:hypothetical protein|nr:pyridoxamine 5'-phosphate oxidase [Candidatus Dormibacteraeota bacterium]
MTSWIEFEQRQPQLAAAGRRLLYDNRSIALAFLATVGGDGAPRVHPVCPVLGPKGLHVLILAGPKQRDLLRDGRYALHSETCPPPHEEDGLFLAGRARRVGDAGVERSVRDLLRAERGGEVWPSFEEDLLFELGVERCLVTLTVAGDDGLPAGGTVWRADRAEEA